MNLNKGELSTRAKRKVTVLITFVAVALLLLQIITGCSGGKSIGTAEISEAAMCSGIKPQTGEPVDTINLFDTSIPEIFCSAKLSNVASGVEVTAVWIYVGGEIAELSNHVIDEYTLTTDGTSYVVFSLSASPRGWPQGNYVVKLFLEGVEKKTVPFTVRSAAIGMTSGAFYRFL